MMMMMQELWEELSDKRYFSVQMGGEHALNCTISNAQIDRYAGEWYMMDLMIQ